MQKPKNKKDRMRMLELYRKNLETFTVDADNREVYFIQLIQYARTHKYEEIPKKHRDRLAVAVASVPWRANKHIVEQNKKMAWMCAETDFIKETQGETEKDTVQRAV